MPPSATAGIRNARRPAGCSSAAATARSAFEPTTSPQGRVTDHRINLTLFKLADIMAGGPGEIIEALVNEDQAEQLATLAM